MHDELHAKALVLNDGSTSLAIVICDVIVVTRETCDAAKVLIAERVDIPPEHILIAATYTHTGLRWQPILKPEPTQNIWTFLF